jgi:hypothetical protein
VPVELVHALHEEEPMAVIEPSLAPPLVLSPEVPPRSPAPPPAVRLADPALDESRAPRVRPLLSLGSLTPPPVQPAPPPPRSILPKAPPTPVIAPADETPSRAVRKPSSYLPAANEPAKEPKEIKLDSSKTSRSMWGLFAVAGIVFAVGARLSRDREIAQRAAPPPPPAVTSEARAPEPTAAPAPPPAPADLKGDGASKLDPLLPQDAPLRAEDKVPPGSGMLEIVAGTSDTVFIDGTSVGNGPVVKRALAPRKEPYEIRVKLRGEERVRFVLVKEGRLTRLRIAPPWSR